nr:hypothetical protein [Candidatus Woesebacteria bacterium]
EPRGGTCALIVAICIFLGVVFLLEVAVRYVVLTPNAITEERAVERFYENTKAKEIVVVRHSNLHWFNGDPRNVDFELLIDGKPVQGVCSSGFFSPMICILYPGGDE